MPPSLLELAEATALYDAPRPGERLLETPRYVLFLGPMHAAQRLRFAAGAVEEGIEEVRGLVREAGGSSLRWDVSDLAEPADLAERLQALGAYPARSLTDAHAVVMALRREPAPGPEEVRVTRVETVEDFRRYVTVTHEVFRRLDRLPAELERIGREGERDVARTDFVRWLAWLDGEPVAAASASFAPGGAILHAGSTLPAARGRGAYRALVAARWREAAARGTPALVTRAGAQSGPILERLGFERLGELHMLDDPL